MGGFASLAVAAAPLALLAWAGLSNSYYWLDPKAGVAGVLLMQILPFAVLLGGILCFWRLTRSSELIVARAAGISAWEFLTAPTLCALLFGIIATALVSPVSSVMLARAEAMDLQALGLAAHVAKHADYLD